MLTSTIVRKKPNLKLVQFMVRTISTTQEMANNRLPGRRDNIGVLPYNQESARVIEKSSKVVLIRHGNSMFNKLFHELEGPGYVVHPRYFDIYSKLEIMDSPLSPLGIKQ